MKLRFLVYLWLLITGFLAHQYMVLHDLIPGPDFTQLVLCKKFKLCDYGSPAPGRPLSYALGWLGFSVMALTNVYILRKKMLSLQKLGNLQSWLNWHIFFGMLGPTFIVFHCDFKVGGIVSISFWSMIVSFSSGIIGRYFYMQLLQGKGLLKREIEVLESSFDKYMQASGQRIQPQALLAAKAYAFMMVGGGPGGTVRGKSILGFLYFSTLGSVRSSFQLPPTPWPEGRPFRLKLKEWALLRKRLISMHYFQMLFGYWRTFHTPFAVWMYIVAVIHIISSLIFKV